jgi:hypothetical protein
VARLPTLDNQTSRATERDLERPHR